MRSVITAAITKLISMFNPAGAIVQAVMAIYNTVMFFIERGSQIAALAQAVFNSIGSIAAGNVAGAASYVEQTIGRSLPVMISFLARLIGLGGVSEHIKNVIKKIQTPIDNAMNKLANFIVQKGANRGDRSSNPQPVKPNSVGQNNQKPAPNNRQNPQPVKPNSVGRNNQRPVPNNRSERQQQQQAKLDHDRKVKKGLAEIQAEEKKIIKGMIRKQEAQSIAAKVKRSNPIFKSITVIDGGNTWDYKWVASEGTEKGELQKEERLLGFARQTFDNKQFTSAELFDAFQKQGMVKGRRTFQTMLGIWVEEKKVYQLGQSTSTRYTFDGNQKPEGSELDRAKDSFGKARFTIAELMKALKVPEKERRRIQRLVQEWLKPENNTGLYRVPGTKDTVAFDPSLAPSKTQQQGRHPSIYVNPDTWEILPQYRIKMRDRFYKKNYCEDRLAEVLGKFYERQDNGNPLYRCAYKDSPQLQGPKHKDFSQYGKGGGDRDHIIDVTTHWESEGGNNMTQDQRNVWYDNPDGLQFLCESCNRAKRKGIFTFKVCPNFRGPNERDPNK